MGSTLKLGFAMEDKIMDVSEAISTRRSVRSYKNQDIDDETLAKIIEAGRLAPSASNAQQWKFIVVKDPTTRVKLAEAASQQAFVGEAPVIIVACATGAESFMSCGQPRLTVDLSIAMSFMILQATELGLGTCWIGAFDEGDVKSILGIPEDMRVVAISPLGYSSMATRPKPRKIMAEVVCYDRYV
jgi:nitroreductase